MRTGTAAKLKYARQIKNHTYMNSSTDQYINYQEAEAESLSDTIGKVFEARDIAHANVLRAILYMLQDEKYKQAMDFIEEELLHE